MLCRMNRLLRAALTGLLLVAVPLQGYAASAMLFCGAAHGWGESAIVDHADHAQAGHAHGDAAHHDAVAVTDADERSSSALTLADLAHGACSVCASCCSGAALPAATITTAFAQQQVAPVVPGEHAAPDRAPARLERPPRTVLA
jgi:hypothetical protein